MAAVCFPGRDGAEAMAVRREPFPITVDVEAAAAKKRVAALLQARKAEEERKQQEQAKLMGVRTDPFRAPDCAFAPRKLTRWGVPRVL